MRWKKERPCSDVDSAGCKVRHDEYKCDLKERLHSGEASVGGMRVNDEQLA